MLRPANSAVVLARMRRLLTTKGFSSRSWVIVSAAAAACSRPWSVSSSSVRPVCLPDFDHSVSPWRGQDQPVLQKGHDVRFCRTARHRRTARWRRAKMRNVTRVLAIANQKGGVAKTTTVASLGAAMVESGERVLLVDLDPQGCLTFWLGEDPDKLAVWCTEVLLGDVEPDTALVDTAEGMTLLPANIDLAGAEAMLLMRAGREYALKRALAKVADKFDVVIIDCRRRWGC